MRLKAVDIGVTLLLAMVMIAAGTLLLGGADPAVAQRQTPCYSTQGGALNVAADGCAYTFEPGSSLTVQGSASFSGTTFGDVISGNYAEFQSDGSLLFYGNATAFDDIRVPATATKNGGSKDPGFEVWKDNGAGSQGVFLHWFDNATEEELYFSLQVPHNWKTGSALSPHIHWVPKSTGSAGAKVNWGLECNWTDISEAGITTTIAYSNTTVQGDATLVAGKHYLTEMTPMTGTGHTLSSMAVCRVYRDAAGALATDSYAADAGLLEIDFHYEVDSIGSRTEYGK